ncbi:hypothetical protein FOZ63_010836, partial [Perkinsus olseni]
MSLSDDWAKCYSSASANSHMKYLFFLVCIIPAIAALLQGEIVDGPVHGARHASVTLVRPVDRLQSAVEYSVAFAQLMEHPQLSVLSDSSVEFHSDFPPPGEVNAGKPSCGQWIESVIVEAHCGAWEQGG